MSISADYISNISQDPVIKLAKGIVFSLLDHKQYKLILFGSRATGHKLKESSDYDFGIIGQDKLPYSQYMMLQGVMDGLPANTDLIDFQRTSPEFREIALQGAIEL